MNPVKKVLIAGQRLAGLQYPANVGISRLALHQVLNETTVALGASIRLGLSVQALDQVGEGVLIGELHVGQGAGMAIEDAVVLGEELVAGGSVEQQFERFMARRFERCKFISQSSVLVDEKEIVHDSSFDRIGLVRQMIAVTAEPI